jgi:phosphoglycerol transferase MdoB-like AlkP superfamily enzyme
VEYVHAWASQNVFLATQFSGISQRYSQLHREQLQQASGSIPDCRDGSRTGSDLIVLILESWSAYHSGLWGGTKNWTPELDAIAKQSLRTRRFVAGGFNTNDGLMAVIAGIPVLSPLTSLFARRSFEPAWGWDYTLPRQLKSGGYDTAFLTSGDLGFMNKGAWLEHVGFDYIEGHDHASYADAPRSHFKSAPDHLLFERATKYWESHADMDQPLGLVIESVSSHTPFRHPISKEPGEEGVIRYLDSSVGDFFRGLENVGYFTAGGVLVIVSDHRSMTVIGEDERKAFGVWAPALIPLIVHGNSIAPTSTDQLAHQSDLAPSLANLLTDRGCGFPGWNNVFEMPEELRRHCAYHSSGTNWEHVLTYCEGGFGIVQLKGDQSDFITSDGLSPEVRKRILDEIAHWRVVTQQQTDQYLSSH